MELIQSAPDISSYLADDEVIDHRHPLVREASERLGAETVDAYAYASAAYEFVRDTIPHSMDSGDPRVTWRASDVLAARTGICFAKSHALTALLRAAGIHAGLCYQRLTGSDDARLIVHGLVAVRLPGWGRWVRQDPRGNTGGVDARFSASEERLAWVTRSQFNEMDYPVVYDVPHPAVLHALRSSGSRDELSLKLPTAL
ncbi:transglutaminase family protein [Streptomyces sp. HB132]|uniref:transglutaminase-like domain-containing protein n=1 Tax=Streptomyces sp. HB132 TaxID=767388 RepID=UPI00195FA9DE|nr:transglutaminase-like domain-containing protein [Streptomyces sp. HB132]MBM7442914.1 transglutaminase-like putative cysteine protease [Streptomyces sp. HB132]